MGMGRSYLLVALAASVSMACPYSDIVIGTNGLAIAGGGTAASDRLAFTVQPGTAAKGNIITPAIQVAALDSTGRTDVAFSATVTVQILLNPVGGNLSGSTTINPGNGAPSFGDLKIHKPGHNYTLQSTAAAPRST